MLIHIRRMLIIVVLVLMVGSLVWSYTDTCGSKPTVEDCKECKVLKIYQDVESGGTTLINGLRAAAQAQNTCEQYVCAINGGGVCPSDCVHGCRCANGGQMPGC